LQSKFYKDEKYVHTHCYLRLIPMNKGLYKPKQAETQAGKMAILRELKEKHNNSLKKT